MSKGKGKVGKGVSGGSKGGGGGDRWRFLAAELGEDAFTPIQRGAPVLGVQLIQNLVQTLVRLLHGVTVSFSRQPGRRQIR